MINITAISFIKNKRVLLGNSINSSVIVFDYSKNKILLTKTNPYDENPRRLVSLREGGGFSNFKYSRNAVVSNTFILQSDSDISAIDVEKGSSTLIESVNGRWNHGMFI